MVAVFELAAADVADEDDMLAMLPDVRDEEEVGTEDIEAVTGEIDI